MSRGIHSPRSWSTELRGHAVRRRILGIDEFRRTVTYFGEIDKYIGQRDLTAALRATARFDSLFRRPSPLPVPSGCAPRK